MRKNYLLNGLVFFILALLYELPVHSQQAKVMDKLKSQSYSEWETFVENEKIIIYTKYSDCSHPSQDFYFEYILFKVANKTSSPVYVTWDFDYAYNNRTRPVEADDEVMLGVTVGAKASVEASCGPNENHRMKLFVRDKKNGNSNELTDFSIVNLKVSNL